MTLWKQGHLVCDVCRSSRLSFYYDARTFEEILKLHKWEEFFDREADEWCHKCGECAELSRK